MFFFSSFKNYFGVFLGSYVCVLLANADVLIATCVADVLPAHMVAEPETEVEPGMA